jgi:hypothetical protein
LGKYGYVLGKHKEEKWTPMVIMTGCHATIQIHASVRCMIKQSL